MKLPCQECHKEADRQVYFTNWRQAGIKKYMVLCGECLTRINSRFQPAQNLGYLSAIIKPYVEGEAIELT